MSESIGGQAKEIVQNGQTRIQLKHSVDYKDANLESSASIIITAPHDIHNQLASAMSWLCAAIPYSSHKLPPSSRTIVSIDKCIIPKGNAHW
jgi:23S rRNA A2030 N6-methylase RlmJ